MWAHSIASEINTVSLKALETWAIFLLPRHYNGESTCAYKRSGLRNGLFSVWDVINITLFEFSQSLY